MQTKHLLVLLLGLGSVTLSGCLARTEASSSSLSLEALHEEAGGPTVVVLERDPLTPFEVALGLDYEVSSTQMNGIVGRVRKEGTRGPQGCGVASDEDGMAHAAYWDHFSMKWADAEKPEHVKLCYLQNGVGLICVTCKGFEYKLRSGVFYREKLPEH